MQITKILYQFNVRVCVLYFLCHCLVCELSQCHVTIIYCPSSIICINCLEWLLYHCCIRGHSTITPTDWMSPLIFLRRSWHIQSLDDLCNGIQWKKSCDLHAKLPHSELWLIRCQTEKERIGKYLKNLFAYCLKLPTNRLSVFGHFVNLVLKGLKLDWII